MYNDIVYLHVLGAFAFALAHGTSMLIAFRVRRVREASQVAELLGLSNVATRLMYVGLVLLLVGGIWATFAGDLWGELWIWASIGLLVAVAVVMYAVATPFYGRMRAAAEMMSGAGRDTRVDGQVPAAPDLAELATSRRPELLALVGGLGLAAILYLMVVKPF